MARPSVGGRLDAGVAWTHLALVGLLPVVAVLAHRGAAPLLLIAGAAVALRGAVWSTGVRRFLRAPAPGDSLGLAALALLGLVIWIALSALIAGRASAASMATHILAPTLAAGALVYEAQRARAPERLARVFVAATAIAIAVLFEESLTGGFLRTLTPPVDQSPERYKDFTALGRGLTLTTPLFFPAAALAWSLAQGAPARAGVAVGAGALGAMLVAASLSLGIAANAAAFLGGAGAAALAALAPRAGVLALGAAAAAAAIVAPLAALAIPAEAISAAMGEGLPASWAQRLYIWREAARAGVECLPFGCGPDYARTLSASAGEITAPGSPIPLSVMPTHPHNAFLQVFLELGVVGAGLFALLIGAGALALCAAATRPTMRIAVIAAAGAAGAAMISLLVEGSLWQVWRSAAFGLAAWGAALSYKVNHKR